MKLRRSLALIALASVLAGVVIVVRRDSVPAPPPVHLLFPVDQEAIQRVAILDGGAEVSACRNGKTWVQEKPVAAPADAALWESRCKALASMEYDKVYEAPPEALKLYGLDPPVTDVVFEIGNGRVFKVSFGENSQSGPRSYARLPDDARVFWVFKAQRELFRIKMEKESKGGNP